ncbi:hypothetical protein [Halobellus captivus]|uniref:hypothetical protein n=1 Tax=Halobellus captivus TaxID=2592614 RepID=UPI0011A02970|nr:hypothetical protein [Halobellus captivus]
MGFPVRYYCPHCGAVVEIQREGYLSDKSVTPYPLAGWKYADPDEDFDAADGVRLVCGQDGDGVRWTDDRSSADDVENPGGESPCGSELFLSFVRYVDGEEVEPEPEPTYTTIAGRGPSGPREPSGPGGFGE